MRITAGDPHGGIATTTTRPTENENENEKTAIVLMNGPTTRDAIDRGMVKPT
jgi:hypothetical protein